jgi:hypothetical protein
MRFYDITITPKTGPEYHFKTLGDDGLFNPGALNIEIDATVGFGGSPMGAPSVGLLRLWGVPLVKMEGYPGISQASDLNGGHILMKAGMSKGLPLTVSEVDQQGVVLRGAIWQAFGNWIGTDMTIDLNAYLDGAEPVQEGYGAVQEAVNLNFTWHKGQKLADAINTTLTNAYPDLSAPSINISDNLVAPQEDPGTTMDLTTFRQKIRERTISMLGKNNDTYPGVRIALSQAKNQFIVTDSTKPSAARVLAFQDLIGQPTWIGFNQLQFTTVMRADLDIDDVVKFPKLQATQTAAEQSFQAKDKSAFDGTFFIKQIRHVGNFRAPDARAWVTVFDAFPMKSVT